MSKPDLIHVASMLFDRPLLITSHKHGEIVRAIGDRLGAAIDLSLGTEGANAKPSVRVIETEPSVGRESLPPVARIGIVQVHGTLVNRGAWMGAQSGLTSYEGTTRLIKSYDANPDIDALVFDFNTDGGDAAGCMDCALTIANVSKPTYAIINSSCNSGGYWLASACDEIIGMQDLICGSVGGLVAHRDETKHNEQQGFTWTIIRTGEHKAVMNPFESLSEHASNFLTTSINEVGDRFISAVATNRGLSVDVVRGWQAAIFKADTALQHGLIDQVMPADEAMNYVANEVIMSKPDGQQGNRNDEQASSNDSTVAPETPPNGQVSASPEPSAEVEEAVQEERKANSERSRAINEACKGIRRPELAGDLIASDLSISDAISSLFKSESEAGSEEVDSGNDGLVGDGDDVFLNESERAIKLFNESRGK